MTDDKKQRIKELIQKLSGLSDEQRQTIAEKLGIMNPEGHILTLRNQSLLYLQAQGCPLSVVAGYKQWHKSGRQVIKGQRGYLIAVPSSVKKSDAVFPINGNEATQIEGNDDDVFFMWKTVFDISQTEEISEQSNGIAA